MKTSNLLIGLISLILGAAYSQSQNSRSPHRFWYKAKNGQPAFIDVNMTDCKPLGTGCVITSGPEMGKQLFTSATLQVPLQPEFGFFH